MSIKNIAIIGAGLSGIVTARTFIDYGFDVTIYEKGNELGGVWAPSRRYPGLATQNNRDTYAFSDFPMPPEFDEWPTGEQVHRYLTSYVSTFAINPHIRLQHEITSLTQIGNHWLIFGSTPSGSFSTSADFVVVCNGTFCEPHIPSVPGLKDFIEAGGKVMHTSEFTDEKVVEGTRTAVVGFSKSASDVVVAVSGKADKTYLFFREAKWKMPRFFNGKNIKYLLLNRLGEALGKPVPKTRFEKFIHWTGLPDKIFTKVENDLNKLQQLTQFKLRPPLGLRAYLFGEGTIATESFYERIASGRISATQGEIRSFEGRDAILSDGSSIPLDVVIFGTGFKQRIPFLSENEISKMTNRNGYFLLHRNILPVGIPNLGFVGYNSSTFTNLTSEFAALWLCEYLKGNISKPGDEEIRTECEAFYSWRSQFRMNNFHNGASVMPFSLEHLDTLLKDMRVSLPMFSLIPDWLSVVEPSRYRSLKNKIMKRSAAGKRKDAKPYDAELLKVK